ncbi:MAG: thiamine pyrophosphate-dependent enzyme [Candidatus Diapherotrites archaeon]|nr:thiamine pyrophosphate-dependent enzyme [Candidatus Diapherotrites archaeon]
MAIIGFEEKEFFASGHRACAGCGEALALRHIMKAAGEKTIVAMATGCMEVVSTPYPETAWKVPWVHCAFENAAAVASGVRAALNMKGDKETNVIAIGGDGASFDIGFGALSGAIERGTKFLYIATDNEAYMNTGIQRSGATFPYAATTTSPAGKIIPGKQQPKKPLPFIVASHGVKYVASASVANLPDLKAKVQKALKVNGPTFLHVYVPCIPGWKIDSSTTIEIARKAVETNVFPLYEIEDGVLKFTQKPAEKKQVESYLIMQGRFKHLTPELVKKIQGYVDARFAFLEGIEGKKCFDVLY